ncbi:cupin domain-containing protein [Halostagnicola sp. A-GB9-2]|uniref:cupin domain-containing protein n=1 Tax=Halostagnicola sp. A-GB9-2 TaxID=3048066 RepID=UPI0024C0B8E8|nr:cupin domain-containing protein [Halostagnicola sp. A-GB9-2]MDJ1433082.1 cupin domain-containing protein [Halostagnicola sp. A-GB9-2]
MGYHNIDPNELPAMEDRSATARSITDFADLNNIGIRTYEAAPGEKLPLAYHYHEEQEEAFFVIDGELHIETPEGEFVTKAGNVFVAEPGSPHRAYNPDDASDSVEVLALGAPSVDDAAVYEP